MLTLAPIATFLKLGATAAPEAPAPYPIHPFVFLVLHVAPTHLVARNFPAKAISYPAIWTFELGRALAEHFTDELPSLNAYMPLFGAGIAILLTCSHIFAHRKTRGPKWMVWGAFALFFASLIVLKAFDVPGVPPDDLTLLPIANKDKGYAFGHVALHLWGFLCLLMHTYHVPWSSDIDAPTSPPLSRRPSAKDAIRFAVKHVKFA